MNAELEIRKPEQHVRTLEIPSALRPTLVVGLGGTGQRIVLQLKGQLLRAYGEVPENRIRLLVFDTADESLHITVDGKSVSLEADREYFNIGHTPVPNIIRNLERQPAIAARLPAIQSIPAVALRNGARQLRPLGLLALLWRYEEVEQRIGDAIWLLAGKDNLGRREGTTQGINVFICNSLVGGTGAGMFLDIAYLVRALFTELGGMGDFCYITGVGVLPQAFRSVEGPNLVPNATAALKELSHCMLRGGFTAQYPNGRYIHTPHAPFDLYYLIDGVDEQGYTWHGVNDLAAMVAAGLFLQIGSQVGIKGENDFDNLSDVLSGQTPEGEGTFCSSFGMATLTFPIKSVAAWCGTRLAGQLIDHGLLREGADAESQERAQVFWQTHILDTEVLLKQLLQDADGIPLVSDPGAAAWLRQPGRTITPLELQRYIHDYRQARVQGDFYAWIRTNSKALAENWGATLDGAVQALLADPAWSVIGTLAWLQNLLPLVKARIQALETQRVTAENERQRLDLELSAQDEALRQAGNSLFLWRGKALQLARARYLESATQVFAWQLQENACNALLNALAALTQAVETWQQRVQHVQGLLKAARQHFAAEEKRALRQRDGRGSVADIMLADPTYCEKLYARLAPNLEGGLPELLLELQPLAWVDASVEHVMEALRSSAGRPFTDLHTMTIEDILHDRATETSPEAYQERLFRLAAPSWNLDLTCLEDGGAHVQTVRVLGVPDETHSLFSAHKRMLASTHDPATITAFVATIGAPFTALQQYPDYERLYKQARRNRPLHVLPQFQAEGEQAKLVFALGILYGLIFNRGFYFYYRPEDALDAPRKLDNGLANSIRAFAENETLVQESLARVEQSIAETGIKATLDLLAGYYNKANGDGADPLVTEMRKLVRAYAEELRSTQQAISIS